MKPVIRPATKADLLAFRPDDKWPTVTATAAEVDGKLVAIGGLAYDHGRVLAFCELTDAARPYQLTLWRQMRRVVDEAKQPQADDAKGKPGK